MNIVEATTEDEMAAVRALRHAVFVVEQQVPQDLEWDGLDSEARHLLGYIDGVPAATLRWRIVDGAGKVERVCVAKTARGSGLGKVLMERVLRDIKNVSGASRAKLGAQVAVIPFYEALGFAAHGPVYDDAGIPHRDMVLTF